MTRPGSTMARMGPVAAALVLLLLGAATGPVRADTTSELAGAKAKLDTLVSRIRSEDAAVRSLQAEANVLAGRINGVQSRIAQAEQQAADLRLQVRQATDRLRQAQAQLDTRARTAFQDGGGGTLEVLLSATSFSNFADRLEFLDRVGQSDSQLMLEIANRRAELQTRQQAVAKVEATLVAEYHDLGAQQSALGSKLTAAQSALSALSADRAQAQTLVGRLTDQRQREVEQQRINAAGSGSGSGNGGGSGGGSGGGFGGGFGGGSGGGGPGPFSVCPVDPPHSYSDDFGAPRWGGGYHTHQGNDIFAPLGTPIRAPFAGSASNATNSIGGLAVIVSGSGGYVYNAHMSRIGSLGSVSAGTVIGYVGNTGDASGGPTHDHFEWHPGGGSAVDPYPYLNQVC